MTLVHVRRFGNELRIFSDMKKTSPTELLTGVNNSVLKAVILRPDLCICFAGNIGPAQVALEQLDRMIGVSPVNIEDVLDHLQRVHLSSGCNTDFIVAILSPKTALHRISDGKTERDLVTCWIGNHDALYTFQRFFAQAPAIDRNDVPPELADILNTIRRTHVAFTRLVESSVHDDVGEFMIEVGTKPGEGFYYGSSYIGFPGSPSLRTDIKGFESIREWAAASGSYGFTIMAPDDVGIGAIAIHFFEGNFGALYYPVKSEKPIIVRDVNEDEFTNYLLEQYGLRMSGLLSS